MPELSLIADIGIIAALVGFCAIVGAVTAIIYTRKDPSMSNSSAAALAAFARVTDALAKSQADVTTRDQTIADLKVQLAAAQPDPTAAQDLIEDEQALTSIISTAAQVAPEVAPQPVEQAATS